MNGNLDFSRVSGKVNDFISSVIDLFIICPNPDKSDPHLMLSTPSSEYYSITDTYNPLAGSDNDSPFLFRCNMTSLPKVSVLDVIAVTENILNCNSTANIDFPNYKFYNTDSKTMAGGAGIYISSP